MLPTVPEGYSLEIVITHRAGSVALYLPGGAVVDFTGRDATDCVTRAASFASWHHATHGAKRMDRLCWGK